MRAAAGILFVFLSMTRLPWVDSIAARKPAEESSPPEVAWLAGLPEVHTAFAWFAEHTRELADCQMEVARIPAPPFHESHRADWMRTRFLELGLDEVHLDEAGNVLGIVPETVAGSSL